MPVINVFCVLEVETLLALSTPLTYARTVVPSQVIAKCAHWLVVA